MTGERRRIHALVEACEDRIRRAAQDVAHLEAELEQLRRGDPADETGHRRQELLTAIEVLERGIAERENELAQLRTRLASS